VFEDLTRHPLVSASAGVAVGAGGQLGATGGTLLTQLVLKQQGGLKNPKEEDARQAFLQHANKVDEFSRFTAAYAGECMLGPMFG